MAASEVGALSRRAVAGAAFASCALFGCGDRRGASDAKRGVLVDAVGIHVDGVRVAAPPTEDVLGSHALRRALQERSSSGATAGASASLAPLDVRLPASIPCLAAMGVLFTAESAGYPRVVLSVGDRSLPLELDGRAADPRRRRLTLAFRAVDRVAITSTDCGGAYDVRAPTDLEASALELTKGPPALDGPAQIRCEPGIPFREVLDVFVRTRPTETSAMAGLRCNGRARERRYLDLALPTPDTWSTDSEAPEDERWWTVRATPMARDATMLAPGSVRAQDPAVKGALPTDRVIGVLEERLGFVGRCYAAGLGPNPTLAGRVHVRLEIGKSGEVMTAVNAGASLPDSGVVRCTLGQLAEATFPASAGATFVDWSLAFRPP